MSRLSTNQVDNLLSTMVPKHEYLLYEIESTDTNSIGLVFRYYHYQLRTEKRKLQNKR